MTTTPYDPPYAIVYTDTTTARRHLARVVAVHGPMTLERAHRVLDVAASVQDAGFGREYRAQIVAVGDPFGVGNPWDLTKLEVEADAQSSSNDQSADPYPAGAL